MIHKIYHIRKLIILEIPIMPFYSFRVPHGCSHCTSFICYPMYKLFHYFLFSFTLFLKLIYQSHNILLIIFITFSMQDYLTTYSTYILLLTFFIIFPNPLISPLFSLLSLYFLNFMHFF